MIISGLPGRKYSSNLEGEDWKYDCHCRKIRGIGRADFGEQLIVRDNKKFCHFTLFIVSDYILFIDKRDINQKF